MPSYGLYKGGYKFLQFHNSTDGIPNWLGIIISTLFIIACSIIVFKVYKSIKNDERFEFLKRQRIKNMVRKILANKKRIKDGK